MRLRRLLLALLVAVGAVLSAQAVPAPPRGLRILDDQIVIIRNNLAPTVAWTALTSVGDSQTANAQQKILWNDLAGRVWQYGSDNAGIYSTAVYTGAISNTTITMAKLASSGGSTNCASYPDSTSGGWNNGDGSPRQPWLSDRHPDFMTAIDTTRNVLYQWSGLACNNAGAGDGIAYRDLWRLTLHADPSTDTWAKVASATQTSTIQFGGSMVYVAPYDALVLHAAGTGVTGQSPETWVLCPTQGAALTATHLSVGCVTPDVWARAYDTVGSDPAPGGYHMTVYSAATDRVLLFVIGNPMQVWSYHLTNKTWTKDTLSGSVPTITTEQVESLFTIATSGPWAGNVFYHQTCHDNVGTCGTIADYMYVPSTGVWRALVATGTGPAKLGFLTFAPTVSSKGGLVAWDPNGSGWWKAVLQ